MRKEEVDSSSNKKGNQQKGKLRQFRTFFAPPVVPATVFSTKKLGFPAFSFGRLKRASRNLIFLGNLKKGGKERDKGRRKGQGEEGLLQR